MRKERYEITDLETKLAEMQNEKDELISKYRYWKGECAELKEQLAKEQKHISRLKNMNKSHDEAVGRLTEENNQLKQQLAEKEQDKISFALEQLEKIINLFEPYENEEKDTILCANNGTSFLEYIDNQINELKEGVRNE